MAAWWEGSRTRADRAAKAREIYETCLQDAPGVFFVTKRETLPPTTIPERRRSRIIFKNHDKEVYEPEGRI